MVLWKKIFFKTKKKYKTVGFLSVTPFQLLWYVVVVMVCEQNPASHRYAAGKKRSTLIAFSEYCEGSTLILYQRSTSFIKNWLYYGIWKLLMNFSYFVTLKSICLSCTLNLILQHHALENKGSQSYADLPNIDTFHYIVF